MVFFISPPFSSKYHYSVSAQRLRCLSGGFTIIELVVTIVIVGILSVAIFSKWNGSSGFDERGFRDTVISGLRYAQKSAVAAHKTVCATFTATTVTFTRSLTFGAASCVGGVPLEGPDSNPFVVVARGAATFAPVPADIVFDAAGRPTTGAVALAITGLPAALNVTVEAETGYVH